MINFTASISSSTLIDGIQLFNENTQIGSTITDFSGNVVRSGDEFGNYIVLQWVDESNNSYTVTTVKLLSGNTVVATSEDVSIYKPATKPLNMRLSAHFENANLCTFNCTTIGLPYATQYRQGVVRLAKLQSETHSSNTVFTAADTIAKIESYISSANQYIPWDTNNNTPIIGDATVEKLSIVDDYDSATYTATLTVDSTSGAIVTDSIITGTAVESTPHKTTSSSTTTITDTTKLVNGSYIAALYSSSIDTSAGQANAHKLVSSSAVKTYVDNKLDGTNNDYVHKAGAETITGAKTFSGGIVANSTISGTGVYATYVAGTGSTGWDNSSNSSKVTTVSAVNGAIGASESAITTAYQTADTNLQSQIDALNAGQNLADIVNTKTALVSHTLTDLKAYGDYKHGTSGDTWTVGDKIQVLHDTTVMSGTNEGNYDDSTDAKIALGVATVYELRKGTKSVSDKKDVASSTTGYFWHFIGEYGCDCYTKAEADSLFVENTQIKQTVDSTKQNEIPSSAAVATYVTSQISTASGDYVKLNSATTQNITSALDITGQVDIDDVTISGHSITGAYTNAQSSSFSYCLTSGAPTTSEVYLKQLSGSTQIAQIMLDGANKTVSFSNGTHNLVLLTTSTKQDASGDFVASYRSVTNGSLTDGRLVTVDFMNNKVSTATTNLLAANNTWTGTNTFADVTATSYGGTGVYNSYSSSTWANTSNNSKLPTLGTVRSAISDAKTDVLNTISDLSKVGTIGLFVYTEVGPEVGIGGEINGSYLRPVGLTLPMSGQISYKSAASSVSLTGTWKLLSIAMKRTATEPCLVLAQKISSTWTGN